MWRVTVNDDIRMVDGCLDYDEQSRVVVLPCAEKKSQKWKEEVYCRFSLIMQRSDIITIITLNIGTDMPEQTVQIQIRRHKTQRLTHAHM